MRLVQFQASALARLQVLKGTNVVVVVVGVVVVVVVVVTALKGRRPLLSFWRSTNFGGK